MDLVDRRSLFALGVGVFFVVIGIMEFPYVVYPCGKPIPAGASCDPTGLGTSSFALLALGGLLIGTRAYYHLKRRIVGRTLESQRA